MSFNTASIPYPHYQIQFIQLFVFVFLLKSYNSIDNCFLLAFSIHTHTHIYIYINIYIYKYIYSCTIEDENLPVLYWLSGLTCDDTNFAMKAGSRAFEAAEKQVRRCMHKTKCYVFML